MRIVRTVPLFALIACLCLSGCGKTLLTKGTEQLLASDAIDRSISKIDFAALQGQTVFLDTQYVHPIKEGIGFVNADYIISALRQQLAAANCLIQEKREDADFIVEARVGALGSNQHEIVYGVPANNALSAVALAVPNAPPVPTIPEISLARRQHNSATAKIAVFAYHRETRQPVWQSGTAVSHSNAKDLWLFGVGPFQSGTVYPETRLAGSKIRLPFQKADEEPLAPGVAFHEPHAFMHPAGLKAHAPQSDNIADTPLPTAPPPPDVVQLKHETPAAEPQAAPSGVSPLNTTKEEFEEALLKQLAPKP